MQRLEYWRRFRPKERGRNDKQVVMTIGPEPIIRIFLMSVRFDTLPLIGQASFDGLWASQPSNK